jgi:endonuclease/exonuclease/phosphatase family metal-dependent hydrolase
MINYWPLKYDFKTKTRRNRTISGLEAIRDLVARQMPERTVHDTLILGTWNIRNFDDNRFGHGPRLMESFYYIAEIISAFDVLAVQEICRSLKPLRKVMDLLGDDYDLIVTDVTEGPSGNVERLGFIYNKHKVLFRNVAGEIVLPFRSQISDVTKERQFARTPFSCSFQAGWFNFVFSTVHIYYGKQSQQSPEYQRRVKEIEAVAEFLKERSEKERDSYILVGDFNIDLPGDQAFNALADQGFKMFQNNVGSNAKKNRFYDQISWVPDNSKLRQAESDRNQGVLDVFEAVFEENRVARYRRDIKGTVNANLDKAREELSEARAKGKAKEIGNAEERVTDLEGILADPDELEQYYVNTWRTFQISDHFPLWVELEIDFSAPYLTRLKTGDF